jgi:hypothetical protein
MGGRRGRTDDESGDGDRDGGRPVSGRRRALLVAGTRGPYMLRTLPIQPGPVRSLARPTQEVDMWSGGRIRSAVRCALKALQAETCAGRAV